jgi:DNA-3-methyladenine glycosylase II
MVKFANAHDAAYVAVALAELGRTDSRMARAFEATGPLPKRRLPKGYATLAKIIVEQQLSVAAANAIWGRIETALGEVTPKTVLSRRIPTLRKLGLGARKAEYVQGIARAMNKGDLDLGALRRMTDEDAITYLTAVRGIGPWTAEIYLLFAEGRADVWPAGDVALQAAAQGVLGLAERPGTDEMRLLAETWSPHRGIAARLLWAYYRIMKSV